MKKITEINKAMEKLVLFRGTKEEIISKLNEIKITHQSVVLEPFENPLEGNDLGFNISLGMIGNEYIDYEIYMLPTMRKGEFLITEINPF